MNDLESILEIKKNCEKFQEKNYPKGTQKT